MSAETDLERTAREASEAWAAMENGSGSTERYVAAQAAYGAVHRNASKRRLNLLLFWCLAAVAILTVAVGLFL